MAYEVIELPGVQYDPDSSTWEHASLESIQITGRPDEAITIVAIFRYFNNEPEDEDSIAPRYFKLIFSDVLEYRYIDEMVHYEDIAAHEDDCDEGLIEVFASEYIENMAAKGRYRSYPKGQRFGKFDDNPASGGIAESEVRHFRLALDKWGKLDVIAMHLSVEPANST